MAKADSAAFLDKFLGRHPKKIDLSLGRILDLLDRMGAPHKALPPVFHVAGTNGKGSTCAFLRAMLEADGKSVHMYTSPHLVTFNERITVNGEMISEAALTDVLSRTDAVAGDHPITYFEATTAAAFLAFAENPADALVLEVGLGGRFDATNVIDAPAAAVLTPVGLDHMDYLGPDIPTIAGEKAGIIKRGAPAVIGRQEPEAAGVLETTAGLKGADLFVRDQQWSSWTENGRLVYQDEDGLLDLPPPRLVGAHQFDNAALAVAALRAARFGVSDKAMAEGVASAFWPGRLQRLTKGPLVDAARGAELWLDGGHNPQAAATAAAAMADLNDRAEKPLCLIVGMQTTKDVRGFFEAFAGLAAEIRVIELQRGKAADAEVLIGEADAAGLPAEAASSLEDAIVSLLASHEKEPRLLICGSLYLAGEVLAENN